MLKLDIDKHCRLRKQTITHAYLRREGFSHWVSHQLTNSKNKNLKFHDLERLCILFKCTPNDLLEWVPNNQADETNSEHPLAPLKKEKNMADDIGNLSYAQLKELAKIIREKK